MTAKFAPEDILKPRNPAIPPQRRCFSSKSCFFFCVDGLIGAKRTLFTTPRRVQTERLFRVLLFQPTSFRISTSVFSLYSIPKNFKISQQPSGSLTPIQTLNPIFKPARGPGAGHRAAAQLAAMRLSNDRPARRTAASGQAAGRGVKRT